MHNTILDWALNLLVLQGLMGAFDTLYHHELTVGLAQRQSARRELTLHAARALLYGVVFAVMANLRLEGLWVWPLVTLVAIEVGLTLWDFVEEDASRRLPASERVLHTLLAINGGALFALYGWQLLEWSQANNALTPLPLDWRSALLSVFAVGVTLSGVRDGLAAWRLRHAEAPFNPFAGLPHQRVLVSGATGFIGEALVQALLVHGHAVTVLARDPLKAASLFRGQARCLSRADQLHADDHFDAVINLAGAPVVGPRWTADRKAQLLASRVETTQSLLRWLGKTQRKPGLWIQASAIGYYGVRDAGETLHEGSRAGAGFMSELCQHWENTAAAAQAQGLRLVTLRLGLVFGPGGALPPLLLPHRFGLGGKMGNGLQTMSWVHRDDVLAIMAAAMRDTTMTGVYNAVAPDPVSHREFAHTVGSLMRRPVWLTVPARPLRWLLGEMAQLFVDGQRVIPRRLALAGFQFRHPTLAGALRTLI